MVRKTAHILSCILGQIQSEKKSPLLMNNTYVLKIGIEVFLALYGVGYKKWRSSSREGLWP